MYPFPRQKIVSNFLWYSGINSVSVITQFVDAYAPALYAIPNFALLLHIVIKIFVEIGNKRIYVLLPLQPAVRDSFHIVFTEYKKKQENWKCIEHSPDKGQVPLSLVLLLKGHKSDIKGPHTYFA